MWHEQTETGHMSERKICPIISDSRGSVLCQGRNCYAAYLRILMAETCWFCTIIDGPDPVSQTLGGPTPLRLPGDHG
ncbi:MAG: hypothetical protein Q7U51_11775 [Methanoregula sp.]|nr:hypothetical protein [Methanoregula sp.]